MRRAQSSKAATYRCPICDRYLLALNDHYLIAPEGDVNRRRHAHRECVLAARRAGRLPLREESSELLGERDLKWWRRLLRRGRPRSG